MYRKHNGSFTKEYKCWSAIKGRCLNPDNEWYHIYGGRGIKICDRWIGEHGFENFLADMGESPTPKHSLDRIDVNGNYEPSNCRWATWEEQANNKRNNIYIEHNGTTHTLCEWCKIFNVDTKRARKRYHRGLSFEKIFQKESLPKLGSVGTYSDDEVRFIRNNENNYDVCRELFRKEYNRDLKKGTYYAIKSKRRYAEVI